MNELQIEMFICKEDDTDIDKELAEFIKKKIITVVEENDCLLLVVSRLVKKEELN